MSEGTAAARSLAQAEQALDSLQHQLVVYLICLCERRMEVRANIAAGTADHAAEAEASGNVERCLAAFVASIEQRIRVRRRIEKKLAPSTRQVQ